jgi:hypothetical protein
LLKYLCFFINFIWHYLIHNFGYLFNLFEMYVIDITLIIYQHLYGYKVVEKLHLGVREQERKRLNTTGLEGWERTDTSCNQNEGTHFSPVSLAVHWTALI